METNFERGTGPKPRKTIMVEDKLIKASFEEEMQLYICEWNF